MERGDVPLRGRLAIDSACKTRGTICDIVGFWSGELTLLEVTACSLEMSSLGEDGRVLGARRSTDVPESRVGCSSLPSPTSSCTVPGRSLVSNLLDTH